MVEHITDDRSRMEKVFLYQGGPGKDGLTITSATGRAERASPTSPIVLRLQDGLQQIVPASDGAGQGGGSQEVVVRFREFETNFANPDDSFRLRGEDEREMTLPELWTATGELPEGVDPWEIQAELSGRLVRILSLPVLPLMAIPLAIGRVRGQRSYGLVVGLAVLIAFHQVLQLGEALADNNKIPIWLGIWIPFALFTLGSAVLFVRAATRVPDPRVAFWLDHQVARLGRLLPRRRTVAASSA